MQKLITVLDMRNGHKGDYRRPLLMKQKKKEKNLLRNSHRRRKKIIILFSLRDCEAKIYKRSANYYFDKQAVHHLELAACSVKYTANVTKIGGILCAWGQAPISSEPPPPGCLHRISRSRSTSLPILWRASSLRAILPPAQSGRADFGPHFQPGKEE